MSVPDTAAPGTVLGEVDAIGAGHEMIACTVCDALHRVRPIPDGGRRTCRRCGATLLRAPTSAIDHTLGGALAMAILLVSAVFFPFLKISASGFSSAASLLDTARAFSGGITGPLAYVLFMLIVIIPVSRAALLFWALLPMRLGRAPLRGARQAFRIACDLKPWSMAEVFIIGVVVSLVKIGGMATVTLGPAFWAMTLIVIIVMIETSSFSGKTIWRMLEETHTR